MNGWAEFRLTLVAYGLVAAPALCGAVYLAWRKAGRLWPVPHLKVGYWSGRTVIGHIILYTLASLVAFSLVSQLGLVRRLLPDDACDVRKSNLVSPLANTLFLAISATLLFFVNRTPPARVGLTLTRWRSNVFIGLAGFLVVTPVVLGLYIAYRLQFSGEDHPFQQLAKEH